MYQLLALDLDDTLLTSEHTISKKNFDAIQQARKQGVKIAICSGRATPSMWPYVEELQLTGEGEYSLPYNGAIILENASKKRLFYSGVATQYIHHLIDVARKYGVYVQLYEGDKLYVEEINDPIARYIDLHRIEAVELQDLKANFVGESIKVLFNGQHQVLEQVAQELEPWVEGKLHMFSSHTPNIPYTEPDLLEFTNLTVNKGLSVLQLAKMLDIPSQKVMAMGDGFNDMYMITAVGKGVTVANAHPAIIQAADYVTKADNNQDAIAEALEKFVLV